MSIIQKEDIKEFVGGTKAKVSEVNGNINRLVDGHNDQELRIVNIETDINNKINKTGGASLNGALMLNTPISVEVETSELALTKESNSVNLTGTSTIEKISGWDSGIVIVQFRTSRVLKNSVHLQLQDGLDRITTIGDVGIYQFENSTCIKEINYFTSRSEKTNSFKSQSILKCPLNIDGKADFTRKIELSPNIVPIMTDNTCETCVISSSSILDATTPAWRAFRGNNNDDKCWCSQTGVPTGWLKIQFLDGPKCPKAFSIRARNIADITANPMDMQIEGSNDDINWDLLADFKNIKEWGVNELRYFALENFGEYTFFRLTITANNGQAYTCVGLWELYESVNDIDYNTANLTFSANDPIVVNLAKGRNANGNINEVFACAEGFNATPLDNTYNYVALEKLPDNSFKCFTTTAMPSYIRGLQRHSVKSAITPMYGYSVSEQFKYGYSVSCSSQLLTAPSSYFHAHKAFDKNLGTKWQANVAGNNQYVQIDLPNFIKAARFQITSAFDNGGGCVQTGYIKGWDGEDWRVLYEFTDEKAWGNGETRYFDAVDIIPCSKFKLEIKRIQAIASSAAISSFDIFELAHCYNIPENRMYLYNESTKKYEIKDVIFIGRIKRENKLITEVSSFPQNGTFFTDEIWLTPNALFSFKHGFGMDSINIKAYGWLEDKMTGYKIPWLPTGCLYTDECTFEIRTAANLMNYVDKTGTAKAPVSGVTLVLQLERSW